MANGPFPISRKNAPGWRTSEFWLAVLVLVGTTILMLAGKLDAEAWQWAVGLTAGGYAVSRGVAKT